MKKNIPYIIVGVVLLGLAFIGGPSKCYHEAASENTDTLLVSGEAFLPGDNTRSYETAPARIQIFIENSGSMNGYINPASEFKDALGKVIVKSDNLPLKSYY